MSKPMAMAMSLAYSAWENSGADWRTFKPMTMSIAMGGTIKQMSELSRTRRKLDG